MLFLASFRVNFKNIFVFQMSFETLEAKIHTLVQKWKVD